MTIYRSARSLARRALTRLKTQVVVARDQGGDGPTFADVIRDRREWLFANLPPESAEYLYDLHPKDKQKALAQRLGLSVAEEYLSRAPFEEALAFLEASEHDAMVLKPMHGRSGAGVFCLVREGRSYRNLRSGKLMNVAALRREGRESYGRLGRRDEWQVEELLLPPGGKTQHIEDLKFFCFAGRTALILQKGVVRRGRRNRPAIRWYDRDWNPVDTGVLPRAVSDELSPPVAASTLVSEAERATSKLPMPFMRIDLYDSHRGVVLGEFTPGPGGLRLFNREWQNRLMRLWREAASELEEGLRTGRVAPLLPPGPEARDLVSHADK